MLSGCGIHKRAWLLVLLSAGLQIVIFPLPNLYFLSWIAITPLLVGLLRTREPKPCNLNRELSCFRPNHGRLSAGILLRNSLVWRHLLLDLLHHAPLWRREAPAACGILILFCLYLALYHGVFGLLLSWLAGSESSRRRALVGAPFLWVAVELARTRITGFPWDLLGSRRWTTFRWRGLPAYRGLWPVFRDHGGEHGAGGGLPGAARETEVASHDRV